MSLSTDLKAASGLLQDFAANGAESGQLDEIRALTERLDRRAAAEAASARSGDVTVTVTREVALAMVALAGVDVGADLTAATRQAIVEIAANDLGRECAPFWQ